MTDIPPSISSSHRLVIPSRITSQTRGSELAKYKQTLIVTERQKEILIGLMLGDGSLQTQNQGKTHRLKYQLTARNRDYANHLVQEFRPWILTEPHEITRVNALGNTIQTLGFQTLSDEKLNFIADIFIKKKTNRFIKFIHPNLVIDHVTPVSLAYWFMDDGGKLDYSLNQGKGLIYNTQGFQKNEVEVLASGLKEKFEFDCWVKANKSKSVIAISGKSFEKFEELVEPHIIPSMKYKLPTSRKK